MTPPRKPQYMTSKRPTIMGFLRQIDHHEFRPRRLCSSERYNDAMREAKREFDQLEKTHKEKARRTFNGAPDGGFLRPKGV